MAEYYAQRASAGLIIAEATMVMEGNSAFWKEPGIYSHTQISAWQQVTTAVHSAGGESFYNFGMAVGHAILCLIVVYNLLALVLFPFWAMKFILLREKTIRYAT